MCLARVQTKKEGEGTINILLLPFSLFCLLKGDSQHYNFSSECFGVSDHPKPWGRLWGCWWLCNRMASMLHNLCPLRQGKGATQRSWFLYPDTVSCHQRLVKPSWLHNWLCLGWLSCVSPHIQLQQHAGEVSTFSWHPLWPLKQSILMQGVPVMEIAWLLGLRDRLR